MKKLIFYITLIGFIASFTISFISLLGYDMQVDRFFISCLFVGALIICLTSGYQIRKTQRNEGLDNNTGNFYKIAFAGKPMFFNILVQLIGLYAVATFMVGFIYLKDGSPQINNGKFILQNKGKFIRILTETEFHFLNAKETGLVTGVLLFFFAFGTGYYYPFNTKAIADYESK